MSRDPLLTYLRDHLAGAVGALELLELLRVRAADPEVRSAAEQFHSEISADREALESVAKELGGGASSLKDAGAWIGEKLARIKLGALRETIEGLALLEAIEAVALGITGKIALWNSLIALSEVEPALPRVNYQDLKSRANQQHERIELLRLRLATRVLRVPPPVDPAILPAPVAVS